MGIHGIYKEIGTGRRVALSKLALEKFEETGRPLRIAIDTSIWLFQIQASKGGTNPALRTFYYRLLRLIALCIHPIFVFDGPNKPPFKRNKRTGPTVASIPEFLAKQLLKQFGYPIHLAPGEAEAECALLQREGIVDAVLSEDVDTLMFGSGISIRNWSAESSSKTPTHVNVYDAVETKNGASGLDREGMILVALMSGGDYVPEGIPGCGPKTACEAARAGFGRDLCRIRRNDANGYSEWRQRLRHELKTNENKLFKRKHGTLQIPDDFPRLDILGYYTHPVISAQAGLDKLRRSLNWNQELDLHGLREFTRDAFDWAKLEGAKHFIRSLAPSLLVRALRMRAETLDRFPTSDVEAIQEDEALVVRGIHGKRQHPVTDNCTELRLSFIPVGIVNINLDDEEPDDEEDPLSLNAPLGDADLDDDNALELEEDGPKKRGPTKFDPHKAARVWVLESYAKVGVPLKVQDWEAEKQARQKPRRPVIPQEARGVAPKTKVGSKQSKKAKESSQPSIQGFAKVTKPVSTTSRTIAKTQITNQAPGSQKPVDTISLLSSSPLQAPYNARAQPNTRDRSPSPLGNLPSSVTRRRRRAPMQRAHTLPNNKNLHDDRQAAYSAFDAVDELDLANSPETASFLRSPVGIFKATNLATRKDTQRSTTVSPGKSKQTTLDTWATPTKRKDPMAFAGLAAVPSPNLFSAASTGVDTLDLTMSSPVISRIRPATKRTLPTPGTRRHARAARSTDLDVSTHTQSTSRTQLATRKASRTITPPRCRRTSPRLDKQTSKARESAGSNSADDADLFDLSGFSSPLLPPARSLHESPVLAAIVSQDISLDNMLQTESCAVDALDLTQLSSPVPQEQRTPPLRPKNARSKARSPDVQLRRSPRVHKSWTSDSSSATSPPAAWKAQKKKKRHIILRKSLAGAWAYADADSPDKASNDVVPKGKDRRRWRESEVELLDLS